jgi:septal ring factor EnvC (AmiA/AmiB activator)
MLENTMTFKTSKYWEEHWNSVRFFATHGGPHLLWLGAVLVVMFQMGLIDKPAWSADVKKLQKQVNEVQKDVGELKDTAQEMRVKQSTIETETKATNKSLDQIKLQLNILINRGLDNGRP